MNIEYNGRPQFERPRKLTEIQDLEQYRDKLTEDVFGADPRQELTDKIYTDLARTYLKGEVLKDGLSKMDPAQYIPIEEFADSARAAANRLAKDASDKGSIIPYGLFQKAVDIVLQKKWELRGTVINMRVPASVEQSSRETTEKLSNANGTADLLKEFISSNGIITTILGMLTLSPFQTVIFQALGVENGAKGVQIAQIPAGIALFLELGIKAERIYKILKGTGVTTPLVEQQIDTLSSSEEARAAAFEGIGIDYNQFKKSQEFQDSEIIIKYVQDYNVRYGGLDRPNGHLTIDHWIAYMHVAQNQQTMRGALNTASTFSPKFKSYKKQFGNLPEQADNIFKQSESAQDDVSNIFVQLASSTRAIRESSDGLYSDILAAFTYQLTDRDLCCLVQIFGKIGNPDIMKTIASLLRILATSLSGEIVRIQNLVARFLANLAQDALFEVMANVNEFYYKVSSKITKAFTVDVENLTACSGMLSLGWALLHSVRTLFKEVQTLLKEISSIIGDFGQSSSGSWKISADRRQLLGVARLLEVISDRLDLANNCDRGSRVGDSTTINVTTITNSDRDFDSALFSILEESPPTLQISEENKQKFFPNEPVFTSDNLKFKFGIGSEQNTENNESDCTSEQTQVALDTLLANIQTALSETFNG